MKSIINLTATIPQNLMGSRLDQALAKIFPEYSRTLLQSWIKNGEIRVDGQILHPKTLVKAGQKVEIGVQLEPAIDWHPQALPLDLVYVDEAIIVVNKPAGLVVHPAAGNPDGTLVNALLNYAPELGNLPRAGIIHRLDKDTSGLLVVARNLPAYTKLVDALQKRKIKREYEAIVNGVMIAGGTIEAPIGRNPQDRKSMAVKIGGKKAVTHYRIIQKFLAHTHLQIKLETGRTHQIRVHLAHLGYPIVGDQTYGKKFRNPAKCSLPLLEFLHDFKRQALHAKCLGLIHPLTAVYQEWISPLPEDMQQLLNLLTQNKSFLI